VAEANRYFAVEALGAGENRSAAPETVLYDIRGRPADRHSSPARHAGVLGEVADSLGIPQAARDFAALGGAARIKPGTVPPAPAPVFPRYVEPWRLNCWNAMLVDSHCHLDFPDFSDDLDAIVARAAAAGIGRIVTISTRVRRLGELLAIAGRFPNVYCSVGTHPHHADEEDGITADELIELTRHPKVVALGEAGLDYFYQRGSPQAQERGFRAHVAAARATGLPLVIHTRDADDDCGRILEDEMSKGSFRAVLHCYTGGRELAMKAISLGLSISFTGILTFKKSQALRDLAAELPADRIMVETDAPYLAPGKFRGKRNEPAYVGEIARVLAETRGISLEEISRQTTENFFRLFSKVPPAEAMA
jgi:TatD DNase family protein